jgi:enoyl-CoA hydratase
MTKEKNIGAIISQINGDVATLTINRPEKLNSLPPEGLADLNHAILDADSDKRVKVIVLTGAGSRSFSTGFDILNVPELPIDDLRKLHIKNQELYRNLMDLEKTTIAAVNGIALGTGFEISLLCDLTVASESAKFGMPELFAGAYPGVFSVTLLWHCIGKKKTAELLLTGKTLTAGQAESLLLVNEVVPDNRLMDRVMDLANDLVRAAPLPVSMFKARTNSLLRMLLEEEMSRFVEGQSLIFKSHDFREGIAAVKEKRKPVFRGE